MLFFTITGIVVWLYILIGAAFGVFDVWRHAARFFVAGWQWRRMGEHALQMGLLWPFVIFADLRGER